MGNPRWQVSVRVGPERHLRGLLARRTVGCGGVTVAPVLWRVIASGFPTDALSPRVDAPGDVRRRVDICLELCYVAVVVWTHERRLLIAAAEAVAGVAGLGGIRRVDVFDANPRLCRLVFNPAL